MDITQMGTVMAIVVICYLIGVAAKQIPVVKDELIPVIVGISGGILGVVGQIRPSKFGGSFNKNRRCEYGVQMQKSRDGISR